MIQPSSSPQPLTLTQTLTLTLTLTQTLTLTLTPTLDRDPASQRSPCGCSPAAQARSTASACSRRPTTSRPSTRCASAPLPGGSRRRHATIARTLRATASSTTTLMWAKQRARAGPPPLHHTSRTSVSDTPSAGRLLCSHVPCSHLRSNRSDKIVAHTPCGSMPPRPPAGAGPDCRDLPPGAVERLDGTCWECTRVNGAEDAPKDATNPCTQYSTPPALTRAMHSPRHPVHASH
jgi:hypothetical protein